MTVKALLHQVTTPKFIRFCLVGGFCVGLNVLLLYILTGLLNIHYMISTVILMFSVNNLGFFLNKRYTFKTDRSRFWKELWKYHTVMITSYIFNLAFMLVLVDFLHIWYIFANLLISAAMTIYNFLMHNNWSFK